MGIFVEGMQMPKNCYECPFSHNNPIGAGMFLRCKSPKVIRDWDDCQKGRYPDCPLRYISEDEIKKGEKSLIEKL